MEGGLLLPWHQSAAVECSQCDDSPHWLIRSNPLGSVLQLGVSVVPCLHPSVLLRCSTLTYTLSLLVDFTRSVMLADCDVWQHQCVSVCAQ